MTVDPARSGRVTQPARPVVIFGAGEMAEVAHYYFSNDTVSTVAAFTLDSAYVREAVLYGLPVIAAEELLERYPPVSHDVFVAVGYSAVNALRAAKIDEMRRRGSSLV